MLDSVALLLGLRRMLRNILLEQRDRFLSALIASLGPLAHLDDHGHCVLVANPRALYQGLGSKLHLLAV